MQKRFTGEGAGAGIKTPDEMRNRVADDFVKSAKVAKEAGMKTA